MRRSDWHTRMLDAIASASVVPFCFGQHDCVMFCAYVVDRMCDTDHFKRLRETYPYRDELDAINIIESGKGLHQLTRDWLGKPVNARQAQPGDVVLMRNEGGALLAIVEGNGAVAAAERGVVSLPMSDAVCAWRIE